MELEKVVESPQVLLAETSRHLLQAGGKRLRPAFALLAAKMFRYDLQKLLPLAMALELIHMATLLHDDVVDAADKRRGRPTVRSIWGNKVSTHTGDFLFAKALTLVAEYENPMIAQVLAQTCVSMSEGELIQMSGKYKPDLRNYLRRIRCKTALLIAASCKLGAVATGAPPSIYLPLWRYGYFLGMAFQITDDVLDIVADERKLGKPVGGDLREGVITLPVILALRESPHARYLEEIIQKRTKSDRDIAEAINIVRNCGATEKSLDIADRYIRNAIRELQSLPDIPTKNTLQYIAEFIKVRSF
ncbi:MAG: polyprenyl synthetase family protein [Peptococcaceae bacterium]|nr:polyprenyl synthetase family protein [Peptococcaceae bacterium]